MPGATVVIVTYNSAAVLAACATALARSTYRDYEIIVVDNASRDASIAVAQEVFAGATILTNAENRGFAAAVNQGAAAGSGQVVVTLNPDTEVQPEWLGALVARLTNDARVGVVGSVIVDAEGVLAHTGGVIDPVTWRTDHARALTDSGAVDFVTGAGMAMRRSDWQAVGGFDETFFPAYFEDVDLCLRVRARGLWCVVEPAATLLHHESLSTGKQSGSFYYYYHRNRWRLIVRAWHRGQLDAQFVAAEAGALAGTNITDRAVALLVARHDVQAGADDAVQRQRVLALGSLLAEIQQETHLTPSLWSQSVRDVLGVGSVQAVAYAELYGVRQTSLADVSVLPTLTSAQPLYQRLFGGGWVARVRTRLLGEQFVALFDQLMQHQLVMHQHLRQLAATESPAQIEQVVRQALVWATLSTEQPERS